MQKLKTMEQLAHALAHGEDIQRDYSGEWLAIDVSLFNYSSVRNFVEGGHIRVQPKVYEKLVSYYLSPQENLHSTFFHETRAENLRNFYEYNHEHKVIWAALHDRATGNLIRHYHMHVTHEISAAGCCARQDGQIMCRGAAT